MPGERRGDRFAGRLGSDRQWQGNTIFGPFPVQAGFRPSAKGQVRRLLWISFCLGQGQ